MHTQLKIITLSILFFAFNQSKATLYGPDSTMSYFTPYKGEWIVPLEDKMKFTMTTTARFSHVYDVFTVFIGVQNEQIMSAQSVTIYNEQGPSCSAVLYVNRRSQRFYGRPDMKSKVLVMKSSDSNKENVKYLIIDFSGCPKKPPTFKVSDVKPKKMPNKPRRVNR